MSDNADILSASGAGLFEGYRSAAGSYDEMLDEHGEPRPHWALFIDHMRLLGAEELNRRWDQSRRLLHENGVTYNIYGDPRGVERPWELDALPILVSADHWATLEAAMIQRAKLLDLVLADIYGPQETLLEGLLPPELVFANPGYLRPCHGVQLPGERHLHLYAADVGRAADGTLTVLGERTQAPSGAGYALENRIVFSRAMPDTFRDLQVQRLALFFRTMRQSLAALAPYHRDNPHIVLLTPGPLNETYFEHAYLARYLGYTLVEGGDLTVRDDKVYLKTLGGLNQVDVVLRRLDDDFCDPLELRSTSAIGIPGLVQAARAGNVAVANALGSGIAETPAFMPFLPQLCRRLLGEDLKLPSVQTWWCGEEASLGHVLANLGRLVVKPAFPTLGFEPVFGPQLSQGQREQLAERIRARPFDYVAQEQVAMSTAPSWTGRAVEPRHMMHRVCLVATPDGSYAAMPGGLTRISPSTDTLVVSMQKGGGSKDTWVLSDKPVSNFSLLAHPGESMQITRGGSDLPSRVADNLFWVGRYVERTEGLSRLIRGILVRLTGQRPADVPELPILLRTLTHVSNSYPGFVGDDSAALLAQPERELLAMIYDINRPGSVRSTLAALRRAASTARDRLSLDTWRVVFNLDQEFASVHPNRRASIPEALATLNRAVITLSAFGGLVMESMTRGLGWTFLDMGRRIERAVQTSCLLRCTLVKPPEMETAILESVLEIADSLMTYRRRYFTALRAPGVIDLLLTDETNPRSIAFQFAALTDHVMHLPGDRSMPARSSEQRIVISLTALLRLADLDRLCTRDEHGARTELDEMLDRIYLETPAISDFVSHAYLSHTAASRQLIDFAEADPKGGGNAL
jgi:uncharacterized circularly permuted ATP-grasp superfamily protein/uncharacterized alpha-E superfamily protein